MRTFYVRVASNDSIEENPTNRASRFVVNLPRELYFRGLWRCGLAEITYPSIVEDAVPHILVLTDFTNESVMGTHELPVLRRLPHTISSTGVHVEFNNIQYIKVKRENITQMSFWLLGENNKEIAFNPNGTTYMTLHFLQK